MNSIISEDLPCTDLMRVDLSREDLASNVTECLNDIFLNQKNNSVLHKKLLETNISIVAYIEESKQRLERLRVELARTATSAHKVVEILSEK